MTTWPGSSRSKLIEFCDCSGDNQCNTGARLATPEVPQRRDRPLLEAVHNHHNAYNSNKENHVTCQQVTLNDQCVRELLKEGHEREAIERALRVTNNNVPMARNILVNFVPKS